MSTNLLRFIKNYSMNFEQSERSMEQNENIILKMSNYVTYLWTGLGLANSFQLLCPQYLIVPLQTTKIICSDFSEKLMSKWCRFVKIVQKCQNGGGFKMSKRHRYVKTLQVCFVKMVQVQKNLVHIRTRHLFRLQKLLWLLSIASI